MPENKIDRRNLKTKISIKNAFLELIEEKSINEISITDLTIRANINRGTFYLHYTDKYDLLNELENEIVASFENTFKNINKEELLNFSVGSTTPTFAIELFKYFKENSTLMKALLSPNGNPLFQYKFKKILENKWLNNFWGNLISEDTMLVPKDHFFAYVLSAHVGLIRHWLETGAKESPEEMSAILLNLFIIGPFNALGIKANNDTIHNKNKGC